MGERVRIRLLSRGIRELLHEVGSTECVRIAEEVAESCGSGFIAEPGKSKTRTWGTVIATSRHAIYKNNKNNVVEKSIGGMK